MTDKLVQLVTAARMMGRPEGATVRQLQSALAVSERTAYRLLDRVEESGFPLYCDMPGHEKIWHLNWGRSGRWNVPVPPASLNAEERAVLGIILGHIGSVPSLSLWSQSLLKKLEYLGAYDKEQSSCIQFSQSDLGKISREQDASFVAIILKAIKSGHTCTVTYKSPRHKESKRYPIFPLCCFLASGGIYLYCVTLRVKKEVLFMLALERIQFLSDDGKAAFVPMEHYDISSLLEDPFGIILEKDWIDTDVVLDETQGWYETQKQWKLPYVSFEHLKDGRWLFHIHTRGFFSLLVWLFSASGHVLGISHPRVREAYREVLRNQLEMLQG